MDKKPIKRKKSYQEDELSNEEKKVDIINKRIILLKRNS